MIFELNLITNYPNESEILVLLLGFVDKLYQFNLIILVLQVSDLIVLTL